ncbi:MAG: hypothetical protein WC438_01815 [Candidatus Pacearchaeota archaeon]
MKIEKHLFIFYISQIITILIIDKFLTNLPFGGLIGGFLIKLFFFSIVSLILLLAIYGNLALQILGSNYQFKRNLEFEDISLTSSAIVTTFLLSDLLLIFNLFPKDFSFILTLVIGIPITFFVIYQINSWVANRLF